MSENMSRYNLRLAKAIRDECVREARNGFREASMRGLCSEGAMEAAISAIQMVNVEKIAREFGQTEA